MYCHLTNKGKYSIDLLLQEDYSQKDIAERLVRSESAISREIKRNNVKGKYILERAIKLIKCRRIRRYKSKLTGKAKNIIKEKFEYVFNFLHYAKFLRRIATFCFFAVININFLVFYIQYCVRTLCNRGLILVPFCQSQAFFHSLGQRKFHSTDTKKLYVFLSGF
jgi:IS30 family transposase